MKIRAKISYYKYGNQLHEHVCIDEEFVNWDDFKYTIKRKDHGQSVRTFSSEFHFTGEARDIIMESYLTYGVVGRSRVAIEVLNNRWGWDELFACDLDFTSLKYDGTSVKISCTDNGLSALLKANGSTKYEIDVKEVKDSTQLYYDRVIRYKNAQYAMPYTESRHSYSDNTDVAKLDVYDAEIRKNQSNDIVALVSLPLNVSSNNIDKGTCLTQKKATIDGTKVTIGTDGACTTGTADLGYFFKATQYCNVRLKARFTYSIDVVGLGKWAGEKNMLYERKYDFKLVVLRGTPTDDKKSVAWARVASDDFKPDYWGCMLDIDCDMVAGEMLSIAFVCPALKTAFGSSNFDKADMRTSVWIGNYEWPEDGSKYERVGAGAGLNLRLEISHDNKTLFYDPFKMDVIKPQTLLQGLLDKMGYTSPITCLIDAPNGSVMANTRIAAAESVRGIKEAKIYTSYKDFCKWMESVFGYIPFVDDAANSVTFHHRDEAFGKEVVKEISNVSFGTEFSIDSKLVYSGVKIGYDKQDYEEEYGRDEWRYTIEYTTGINVTSNVLDLVSPYRCDSYGMEYIAAERRHHDTTDDSEDTDVFFVHCQFTPQKGTYTFVRNGYTVTGVEEHADSLFNIAYSQRYMIEANKTLLSGLMSMVKFASLEGGNSEVTISGSGPAGKITDNVIFSKSNYLYTCGSLSVETEDIEPPEDWHGIVKVIADGTAYLGYVDSVDIAVGREKSTKYTITVKSINQQ